jgi:heterodisulfide reductase subunit B2
LLDGLGAAAQEWSYATDCCGASMTLNRSDLVIDLVGRLLDGAEEAGANCIVTACPLCQANLDGRQPRGSQHMPIFYFTELIGLALGISDMAGVLAKHATDPRPLLRRVGLL